VFVCHNKNYLKKKRFITCLGITMKVVHSLAWLYERIPKPKYVIAMRAYNEGISSIDSYGTVWGYG